MVIWMRLIIISVSIEKNFLIVMKKDISFIVTILKNQLRHYMIIKMQI